MEQKLKIIGAVIFLALAAWLGLFLYNKYNAGGIKPAPAVSPGSGQLPASATKQDEKEVKILAENFLSGYGSYQKGKFSSLKEVKKMMTKKYQEETTRFIEEKEKEQSSAEIKEYITYTSIPVQTTLVSLDPKSAKVLINFERNTFYGVSLYLNGVLTTIDQNGNKTTQSLKRETAKKQAIILMIKEDGMWKVDSIKIE